MKKKIIYSVILVFSSFFMGFSQKTETNKIPPGGGGGGELQIPYYRDADNDTYGDRNNYILSYNSFPPIGYVGNDQDCDDTNASISYYDITYYYDYDHDGYGNPLVSITQSCLLTPPKFYVLNNTDCDDANNSINSGVAWYLDDNSDGVITPNETTIYYGCYAPNENYINSLYQNFHWIHNTLYDINNNIISNSRVYYDDLGRSNLTLSKDIANNKMWASETIYDNFGRASKTSFPTISSYSGFNKIGLLSTSNYSPLNNLGVYNGYYPTTTDLATYYSNNNTLEPYQATANQPYTEVEYDKLNPGNVIRSFGGNQINNEWKTGYSYTVPAAQEMHYAFGHAYYNLTQTSPANGQLEVITKFYKTVNVDPHGVETVAFSDGEGKTIAVARSGSLTISYPVFSLIGTQGYIDVHIPNGVAHGTIFGFTNTNDYEVYDLKSGDKITPTPSTLASGNAYRVVSLSQIVNDSKVFVNINSDTTPTHEVGAKGVSYSVNYYEYSLNVYNKTGQLTRVVQPKGYENNTVIKGLPTHMASATTSFITTYKYNALGQLIETTSPDEGTSKFAYRRDGNIRYSQSALQAPAYIVSYTEYDNYARPIESGILNFADWNEAVTNVDNALLSGTKTEQTFTIYDYETNYAGVPAPPSLPLGYTQNNLAGNVVTSWNSQSQSWYSYDIYGRLEWMVQNISGLGVKTIHYVYDAKGQVSQVDYQRNTGSERFIHKFSYNNINGRLEGVETSTNSTTWTKHADYEYYLDGKLKRVVLAEGIQGTDYVYTLGGMLKSINHPSLLASKDPGKDGLAGTPNASVSPDVFGITLDYYNGDYTRAGTYITTSSSVGTTNPDNYDGNIKAIRWANSSNQMDGPVSSNGANTKAYLYKYNTNKWLQDSYFTDVNLTTQQPITPTNNNWREGGLTYDANGNIKTLTRTNASGVANDILIYDYKVGKNQLDRVADTGTTTPSASSNLENQSPGNYEYNDIGQLTDNVLENLKYIYNTRGLTKEVRNKITNNPIVKFYYNERGVRIKKEFFGNTGGTTLQSADYYVLDASGNVISIYSKNISNPIIKQKELPIYGNGRIGVFYKGGNPSQDYANYEITDHLGNVRAVIKKQTGTNFPLMIQYADYYPFGEQLPERNTFDNYRYAYQGQELDKETGNEAFKLRLWDGRIGRWLSPDPYGQYHSPYLGMGNNPISSIDPDGGWESKFSAWWHGLWDGRDGEIFQDKDKGDWGIKYSDWKNGEFTGSLDYGGKRYENKNYDYNLHNATLTDKEFNLFYLQSFEKYETYEKYFDYAGNVLGGVSATDLLQNGIKSLADRKISKTEWKDFKENTIQTIKKPTFILGTMSKAMASVEGNMKDQWYDVWKNYTNTPDAHGVRMEKRTVLAVGKGIPGSHYPMTSIVVFYDFYTIHNNVHLGSINGF
jgi:RHS repeat-associated protein